MFVSVRSERVDDGDDGAAREMLYSLEDKPQPLEFLEGFIAPVGKSP